MHPEIKRYLDEHGTTYTPEALRKGMLEAGYDSSEVDAAIREWQVAGSSGGGRADAGRSFARWAATLHVGALVATFGVLTVLKGIDAAGTLLLGVGVLAVALLIGWAISSIIGRALLPAAGTAMALVVPAISAILLGGTCIALLNTVVPTPPRDGTVHLRLLAPLTLDSSGAAACYLLDGSVEVNSQALGPLEGRNVHLFVYVYPNDPSTPAPIGGTQVAISLSGPSENDRPQSWSMSPDTRLTVDASVDGRTGSLEFEDLAPEVEAPGGGAPEPLSGSVSWTCD